MAEEKTLSLRSLEKYLQKFSLRDQLISDVPAQDTGIFIVVPAYKEELLINCMESLQACKKAKSKVELILLFNASRDDHSAISKNLAQIEELGAWIARNELSFDVQVLIEHDLDPAEAGVGIARKIGMDEAARRALELNNPEAAIVCLDADCTVSENYFTVIEEDFLLNSDIKAASIQFEHPLNGTEHEKEIYEAIAYYELHLRYFKWAMNYCGIPYDRYTVGSSMLVRASEYAKEGGMNKKKAGEDFYFLQKYLIKKKLSEITTTTVYPSPRISDRVPFGTGRAILDHQEKRKDLHYTYSFKSFQLLKDLINKIKNSYPELPEFGEEWNTFLDPIEWEKKWLGMIQQSRDWYAFEDRFLQWFTPFRLLKFIHHLRDHYFENEELIKEVEKLFGIKELDVLKQLEYLRKKDRYES